MCIMQMNAAQTCTHEQTNEFVSYDSYASKYIFCNSLKENSGDAVFMRSNLFISVSEFTYSHFVLQKKEASSTILCVSSTLPRNNIG